MFLRDKIEKLINLRKTHFIKLILKIYIYSGLGIGLQFQKLNIILYKKSKIKAASITFGISYLALFQNIKI